MESSAASVNGVPIRLTDERWGHITEEHNEMAGLRLDILETITNPRRVLEGTYGEALAVREFEPGKWLVVIYRESSADDGFVITAFLTRRVTYLERRVQLWP